VISSSIRCSTHASSLSLYQFIPKSSLGIHGGAFHRCQLELLLVPCTGRSSTSSPSHTQLPTPTDPSTPSRHSTAGSDEHLPPSSNRTTAKEGGEGALDVAVDQLLSAVRRKFCALYCFCLLAEPYQTIDQLINRNKDRFKLLRKDQ